MKAQSEKKHGSDKEERGKLPESPKTAEEIWQQSVIGDYLARFKVRNELREGLELGSSLPPAAIPMYFLSGSHLKLGWELWGDGGHGGAVPHQQHPSVPGFLGVSDASWWFCPTE